MILHAEGRSPDDLESFDPAISPGVSTVILLDPDEDPAPWLDGSARSPLFVLLGERNTVVEGVRLEEHDGFGLLKQLEDWL